MEEITCLKKQVVQTTVTTYNFTTADIEIALAKMFQSRLGPNSRIEFDWHISNCPDVDVIITKTLELSNAG